MFLAEDKTDDLDLEVDLGRPCRLCHNRGLVEVFDLGVQAVGSYFPATPDEIVPSAPLRLMQCPTCSLVQLSDGCDHEGIYRSGDYGYRSGQNPQMVEHLREKAKKLHRRLRPGDVVCDIGSNDGTFLAGFSRDLFRVGFDPTSVQFASFYDPDICRVPDLFTAKEYHRHYRAATLITSLSMLYDLEDPVAFAREVVDCLTDDGIWHFEQCYLPSMLQANSYDTICHEHLTYYTCQTVRAILEQVGMHMVDVEFNDVNGGSFAVTARKDKPSRHTTSPDTQNQRSAEGASPQHLRAFRLRALHHRDALRSLLEGLHDQGARVGGLGASTKGSTLLQFVGLGQGWLEGIGEVNPQIGKSVG